MLLIWPLPALLCTVGMSGGPATFCPATGLGPLDGRQLSAAVVSCLLLPILFVDIRKGLSRLSAVGLSSCLLVIAVTLGLLALDPRRAALPQQVGRVADAGVAGPLGRTEPWLCIL